MHLGERLAALALAMGLALALARAAWVATDKSEHDDNGHSDLWQP
jgi:hypothetical protein